MVAQYLWIFGSLITIILGVVHLIYIFFTNKFSPRNKNLENKMKTVSPILTRETTIWKAWIGFNASHSYGIIFIGLINFYISYRYFILFKSDHFYFIFNIITISFYALLAKKYWFKIPLIGILITLICVVLSYILTIIKI